MTRPNRHDAAWSSSVERCLGLVHTATPYFPSYRGTTTRKCSSSAPGPLPHLSRTGCSHPTPTLSTIAARPGTSSSSGPGRSCPSAYATGPMGSDQRKLVLAVFRRLHLYHL